jgi:hypothetical protein
VVLGDAQLGGENSRSEWTAQAKRPGLLEGNVDQRLVEHRLLDLRWCPADVDQLAESADATTRILVQQVAPQRQDAGRVATDLCHVNETDVAGALAEFLAQQGDLRLRDGNEHHLAGVDPGADERSGPAHELFIIGIDEGVVLKTGGGTVQRPGGAVDQHLNRVSPNAAGEDRDAISVRVRPVPPERRPLTWGG